MNNHENIIHGICCDVSNCVHNDGNCCCTAGEVHVECPNAKPGQTCCGTFREG